MSATPHPLRVDATLVDSLSELFAELPASVWARGTVDPSLWEAALLEPARDILSRSGKGFRARLVEHAWELAGGAPSGPPDVLAVTIELLHVGSLVVDDIEDDSRTRRGRPALHREFGLPIALNTGNWLYFVALALLSRSALPAELRLALHEDVAMALLRCHQGQALDLSTSITVQRRSAVPGIVDGATRLKTGSLMQLAALLGARATGAGPETVQRVGRFGCELGVGLQMLDDWSGVAVPARREKGREDVRLARPTWPWAWLAEVADDLRYAQIARQARGVTTDWEVDRLLEELGSSLAPIAGGRIRDQLDEALECLVGGDFPGDALQQIGVEIDRLEHAFG